MQIPPINEEVAQQARQRQNQLTKPIGALGRLEELSIALAGMTGRLDWLPQHRAVVVCAGDHGVTAQGISAFPSEVTAQMVMNFLKGGAAVNVLASQMNARVTVVDAGVKSDLPEHPQLVKGKIDYGTADFSQQPAMTLEQAKEALALGLQVLEIELQRGLDVLCVGEMGIGNTTAASAMIAILTNKAPSEVTGRGTGLDNAALKHKIEVIENALTLHKPTRGEALQKVGGFEIGAMAGLMIGAAAHRIPIIVDGLISTAAALFAAYLHPEVKNYMIAGHQSMEPGHKTALEALGLKPLLDLSMRLGEGTGAVMAIPILEAAMRTLQEMATFDEAGVSS
jgi:nicotinate-nucleotide--dimethylbenzimidazole phosphoribosyltransferase